MPDSQELVVGWAGPAGGFASAVHGLVWDLPLVQRELQAGRSEVTWPELRLHPWGAPSVVPAGVSVPAEGRRDTADTFRKVAAPSRGSTSKTGTPQHQVSLGVAATGGGGRRRGAEAWSPAWQGPSRNAKPPSVHRQHPNLQARVATEHWSLTRWNDAPSSWSPGRRAQCRSGIPIRLVPRHCCWWGGDGSSTHRVVLHCGNALRNI